ncbi:MAG: nitroreductase family protein [Acidobacteriota bacterium]
MSDTSATDRYPTLPYHRERFTPDESLRRADDFYALLDGRRSIRQFSPDPVPRALIERAIQTASTAPSGAHRQPWRFVAVSDPAIKRRIRIAAEAEEKRTYEERMSDEWRAALAPIGTTWKKPFLETVPWIVVAFEELWGVDDDGNKVKNYYVGQSTGLACGMFIAALHNMGLATLTHTPSPMGFLRDLLGRPKREKPFILFPIGYPAENAEVPDLRRKALVEVAMWNPQAAADGEASGGA